MSMGNYGIYQQGAIFYQEDFEPAKVILAACEKLCGLSLSENVKDALIQNEFSTEIAIDLCKMLDIKIKDSEKLREYTYISNNLIPCSEHEDWFQGIHSLMGTSEINVSVFSNIEGTFTYDNNQIESELVENCYMLTLSFPLVWEIGDYSGCRTRDEVLHHIRKSASALLKDSIDWSNRLGVLTGSVLE